MRTRRNLHEEKRDPFQEIKENYLQEYELPFDINEKSSVTYVHGFDRVKHSGKMPLDTLKKQNLIFSIKEKDANNIYDYGVYTFDKTITGLGNKRDWNHSLSTLAFLDDIFIGNAEVFGVDQYFPKNVNDNIPRYNIKGKLEIPCKNKEFLLDGVFTNLNKPKDLTDEAHYWINEFVSKAKVVSNFKKGILESKALEKETNSFVLDFLKYVVSTKDFDYHVLGMDIEERKNLLRKFEEEGYKKATKSLRKKRFF